MRGLKKEMNIKPKKKRNKRLLKDGDGFRNDNNVYFTKEQKLELQREVKKANAKRSRMLKKESEYVHIFGGEVFEQTKGEMGAVSDFIMVEKNANFQKFRNIQEYEIYLQNVKNVNDRQYIPNKIKAYKENHILAIERNFPKNVADELIRDIKKMSMKKYVELLQHDEAFELAYIYDVQDQEQKIKNVKNAINAFFNNYK